MVNVPVDQSTSLHSNAKASPSRNPVGTKHKSNGERSGHFGSRVTSDVGLILVRELDVRLGLSEPR